MVPSVISVIGLTALTFAGPFYDKLGTNAALVGWGSAALAAGGAIASYPLGGFACRSARKEYNALWHTVDPTSREFIVHTGFDSKASADYLDEMKVLAQKFNAGVRRRPDRNPDADAEVDAPAPEKVVEVKAALQPEPTAYNVGDKVLVSWKGTFCKAEVLRVEADGKYKIRYDGYDATWDEVVAMDRMKRR